MIKRLMTAMIVTLATCTAPAFAEEVQPSSLNLMEVDRSICTTQEYPDHGVTQVLCDTKTTESCHGVSSVRLMQWRATNAWVDSYEEVGAASVSSRLSVGAQGPGYAVLLANRPFPKPKPGDFLVVLMYYPQTQLLCKERHVIFEGIE